jgi:hypothetical protein
MKKEIRHMRTAFSEFYIHVSVLCGSNWITIQQYATVFSLSHICRQLYMFRVLTPIIRSSYNCNYSFWHWPTGSATIRSRCWVPTQVVRAPDDGCQHPKHVELFTDT